jgi:acetyl-CoA C-acetyltransferase
MSFYTEVVMKDVVIVGALRTAIGCFQGALSRHSAVDLGSVVVKALVERSGIAGHEIDEVILGQVLTAGAGKTLRARRRSKAACRIPCLQLPSTMSVALV